MSMSGARSGITKERRSSRIPLTAFGGPHAELVLRRVGVEDVIKEYASYYSDDERTPTNAISHEMITVVRRHPAGSMVADFWFITTDDQVYEEQCRKERYRYYGGPSKIEEIVERLLMIYDITGGAEQTTETHKLNEEKRFCVFRVDEYDSEKIPHELKLEARKILVDGLRWATDQLKKEQAIINKVELAKPALGANELVSDEEWHIAKRLDVEGELLIKRSRTKTEKALFGPWHCVRRGFPGMLEDATVPDPGGTCDG